MWEARNGSGASPQTHALNTGCSVPTAILTTMPTTSQSAMVSKGFPKNSPILKQRALEDAKCTSACIFQSQKKWHLVYRGVKETRQH